MGKIEDPQDTKGEGKARGDQKEQGAPGYSTHELIKKDIKRHIPYQKERGMVEEWNTGMMGLMKWLFIFPIFHHSNAPSFLFVIYLTTPVFFQTSLTLASDRHT
jgi:hypothetical protein